MVRESRMPVKTPVAGTLVPMQKMALMPWLSLNEEIKTRDVTFRPIILHEQWHPLLQPLASRMEDLLKFFPDRAGGGVFVTLGNDWWTPEERLPDLAVTAGHLYLAAFACQKYFSLDDHSVNSAAFEFYGVALTDVLSFQLRTRLGPYPHFGYTSDMVQFRRPPQTRCPGNLTIQLSFLDALGGISSEDSIRSALSFFLLATRDEQSLNPEQEIILMGAAFERLLGQHTALKVALALKRLMSNYCSSSTVASLRLGGRPVRPCEKTEHEEALASSAPHVGWAYEFYQERNGAIHGDKKGPGGWKQWEHLIMSGHLFPLLVKLKLESEGQYELDDDDKQRLLSVDWLLAETDWIGKHGEKSPWQRIHWEAHFEATCPAPTTPELNPAE